jgi:hypothetical protein
MLNRKSRRGSSKQPNYQNADDELICYVIRLDLPDGGKIPLTICWATHPDGKDAHIAIHELRLARLAILTASSEASADLVPGIN